MCSAWVAGRLFSAIHRADADHLIQFIFPTERLPGHTQVCCVPDSDLFAYHCICTSAAFVLLLSFYFAASVLLTLLYCLVHHLWTGAVEDSWGEAGAGALATVYRARDGGLCRQDTCECQAGQAGCGWQTQSEG